MVTLCEDVTCPQEVVLLFPAAADWPSRRHLVALVLKPDVGLISAEFSSYQTEQRLEQLIQISSASRSRFLICVSELIFMQVSVWPD